MMRLVSPKGKVMSWESILDAEDEAEFQALLKDMDKLRHVQFSEEHHMKHAAL